VVRDQHRRVRRPEHLDGEPVSVDVNEHQLLL
jgi:hypothetical protein